MSPRTIASLATLLVVAAAGAGCGDLTRGKDQATQAVAAFHQQFNEGRFESIWDGSDDQLKAAAKREDFTALLGAVRRKLGDVTGTSMQNWNVSNRNLVTYVALSQDTMYARGRATETFRFVIRDGRAVLLGWHVSSNDLILR